MCRFIWPTNGIYKVFWHFKMNFIKVFKMLLKRQYLYSSGWLILLHFFKKNLGRVPGVFTLGSNNAAAKCVRLYGQQMVFTKFFGTVK